MMPKRMRTFVAALLAALLIALSRGSASAHEGHAALPSTGAKVEGDLLLLSPDAQKAIGVATAKVTLGDLHRTLHVNARVELPWNQQALVTTLAPGRVEAVLVKPGQAVDAGQELARIASLELESLQLGMLQAATEIELAERIVRQRQGLADKGVISGASLLEAETQLRQKTVELDIARRKLQALGLTAEVLEQVRATGRPVRTISVVSPIGGSVLHADVRIGEFVETNQHLFNIVDASRVWIIGDVLETDAAGIRPGQPVEVGFAALPGQPISGAIERVQLTLNEEQRTLGVVVFIENHDQALRPGMFGRMAIRVGTEGQAVLCPTDALIEAGGRTFVLVRRGDGKYQRKPVEIGLRTADRTEVVAGLFPGQQVIVVGTQLLGAMFHTDRSASAPPPGRTTLAPTRRGAPPSAEDRRDRAVALAQAVVELPTDGQAAATAAIEGRVVRVHVGPGESVEAGQALAELDSQELRNLQLDLLQTQERLRWVRQTIARLKHATQRGAVPEKELWQPQTEELTLEQRAESLARKLEMIGLSSADIEKLRQAQLTGPNAAEPELLTVPVRAPLDGQIATIHVVPGQVVRTDVPLFEIQNLSTVWIRGYVAEADAPRVRVGQAAVARFPAFPDLQLEGEVVRLSPTFSTGARVLPVWIEVENPENKLRAGLFATVELVQPKGPGNVAVRTPQR